MISTWQAPQTNGKTSEELMLALDQGRATRVLILPALFDEANKLRRFTVQMMRDLDAAGADCFLPDLPGCNESTAPLLDQTLSGWRAAAIAAADQIKATHILTIRAGAIVAPRDMTGWHYAPQTGPKVLRSMLRARTISAREEGREESSEQLLEMGRREGIILAGWPLGAQMVRELESAEIDPDTDPETERAQGISHIPQKTIGGAGLWLRAEPDEDPAQSAALAAALGPFETGAADAQTPVS